MSGQDLLPPFGGKCAEDVLPPFGGQECWRSPPPTRRHEEGKTCSRRSAGKSAGEVLPPFGGMRGETFACRSLSKNARGMLPPLGGTRVRDALAPFAGKNERRARVRLPDRHRTPANAQLPLSYPQVGEGGRGVRSRLRSPALLAKM